MHDTAVGADYEPRQVRLCGRFLLALPCGAAEAQSVAYAKQQERRGVPLKEPHFTALTSKGHVVKLV